MDALTSDDREALVLKISAKIKNMTDDELADLAKELDTDDDNQNDSKEKSPLDQVKLPGQPSDGSSPIVDTSVLAGPIPALKSFLIQSQRDNDAKA